MTNSFDLTNGPRVMSSYPVVLGHKMHPIVPSIENRTGHSCLHERNGKGWEKPGKIPKKTPDVIYRENIKFYYTVTVFSTSFSEETSPTSMKILSLQNSNSYPPCIILQLDYQTFLKVWGIFPAIDSKASCGMLWLFINFLEIFQTEGNE